MKERKVLSPSCYLRFVKQVFTPGSVGASEVTHDLPVDVMAERLRAFEQSHAGFFGQMIALAVVAAFAASHEIVPTRSAAARFGNDVVKRKFRGYVNASAILASVMVAPEDVFARQAFAFEWDVYVIGKANHGRYVHAMTGRTQ